MWSNTAAGATAAVAWALTTDYYGVTDYNTIVGPDTASAVTANVSTAGLGNVTQVLPAVPTGYPTANCDT